MMMNWDVLLLIVHIFFTPTHFYKQKSQNLFSYFTTLRKSMILSRDTCVHSVCITLVPLLQKVFLIITIQSLIEKKIHVIYAIHIT